MLSAPTSPSFPGLTTHPGAFLEKSTLGMLKGGQICVIRGGEDAADPGFFIWSVVY